MIVHEISHQSVRFASQTHKVIAELVRSGTLEVLPGVGTVVAEWGPASPEEMRQLLSEDVERLLVEAKRLGLSQQQVQEAVALGWAELFDELRLEAGDDDRASSA